MATIEQELHSFITDNFVFDDRRILDTDSFLEHGIIDSIGILQLINFVEQRYHIELDDREIVPENLDCIRNIANLVRAKLADNDKGARYKRVMMAAVIVAAALTGVHRSTNVTHVPSVFLQTVLVRPRKQCTSLDAVLTHRAAYQPTRRT